MRIRELQSEHHDWLTHNFPDQQPHQPLLGLAEEVGELAHAHLKGEQGIRQVEQRSMLLKVDAVADIFIYLMSYCNSNGIDLEAAIETTWDSVSQRDWIANPRTGKVEP